MTKKVESKSTKVEDSRKFRGTLGKRKFSVQDQDPNFEYRWVITETGYMNNMDEYERVDQFIEKGWDVVYSEERPEDERSNAPDNDTKNSDRLKPVTKRLRGGNMAVLMKCTKEQRLKNEADKAARDLEVKHKSAKSVNKSGSNITVQEQDVNLNNSLGD